MTSTQRYHGQVRGENLPRRSVLFQGRFGRIFRTLPPAHCSDRALEILAQAMVVPASPPVSEFIPSGPDESSKVSAGYTYFGQFIVHDVTFDPLSSLVVQNDPDGLVNFRTPRLDLDCVYGRGPADQPYLYRNDGIRFRLGRRLTGNQKDPHTRDLPRYGEDGAERALIGDPRNDENIITSQLHGMFLRFHNALADRHPDEEFATIQRLVRWHYQWAVLFDYLPTIIGWSTLHSILPHLKSGKSIFEDAPRLRFVRWREMPYIPIEFSAAAFRFGHSMVRQSYRLNPPRENGGDLRTDALNGRKYLFAPDGDQAQSLTGFRAVPHDWAIDWSLFFDMGLGSPAIGPTRVQPSSRIDTSLVSPLGTLPHVVARGVHSLAERNLKRGLSMGLPSGQDVARAMDVIPLDDNRLTIRSPFGGKVEERRLVDLPEVGGEFADSAPLWFYILAEAQSAPQTAGSGALGEVGARIVGETILALLVGDSHSFLSQHPGWSPGRDKFGIAEFIKMAADAQ